MKIQTLNILTQRKRTIYHYEPLEPGEVALHKEFIENYNQSQDYASAQLKIIKKLASESNVTQNQVSSLAEIRESYFKASTADVPEITGTILLDSRFNPFPSTSLLDFLTPLVKSMSEEAFNILISLSTDFPHLVHYTLQPTFILALGIPTFICDIPILFHKGNFVKLLTYCRESINFPLLKQLYTKVPYMFKVGGICLLAVGGATWFSSFYFNSTIKTEGESKAITLSVPNKRIGGAVSDTVDIVAKVASGITAELSHLLSEVSVTFLQTWARSAVKILSKSVSVEVTENPSSNTTGKDNISFSKKES